MPQYKTFSYVYCDSGMEGESVRKSIVGSQYLERAQSSSDIQICIVEDNEVTRYLIEKYLYEFEQHEPFSSSGKKFYVHTYETGEELLHDFPHQPDLILLDYYLNSQTPEAQNGLEIKRKIHQQNADLKVIFLSGDGDTKLVLRLLKEGINHFVFKGDDFKEELKEALADELEDLLNR